MSLFTNTPRASSKNIVEFRAGKMNVNGTTVSPDKRKGQLYVHQADDSLMHFCWKDRTSGTTEDDLIIFPDDCELKRVPQCTTGRVYLLKFKSTNRRMFFWMQEPKSDKDEELCKKVNDALNNPHQQAQTQSSAADLGGLDGLGQSNLQELFNTMDQQQFLNLMAGSGLGNILSSNRMQTQRGRSQQNASSRPAANVASSQDSVDRAPSQTGSGKATQQPAVQLSQLQDILSQMGVPKPQSKQDLDLAEVITPETMIPILSNAEVQERLKPFLPQGETLSQTAEELRETLHSPHFRQAMASFSTALASGQLGPVLSQFGLSEAAQTAASKGDVEGFAKAMQEEQEKKGSKDEEMATD